MYEAHGLAGMIARMLNREQVQDDGAQYQIVVTDAAGNVAEVMFDAHRHEYFTQMSRRAQAQLRTNAFGWVSDESYDVDKLLTRLRPDDVRAALDRLTTPITILDLAIYRLQWNEGDTRGVPGDSIARAGLPLLGGCQGCKATLAAYNAYPSISGFWLCRDCVGARGYATVQEANVALFGRDERVVLRRIAYDGEGEAIDYSDSVARFKVGDRFPVVAGAPGTGRWVYEITRIDEEGLWGVEVENTVRELTEEEVR